MLHKLIDNLRTCSLQTCAHVNAFLTWFAGFETVSVSSFASFSVLLSQHLLPINIFIAAAAVEESDGFGSVL